MHCQLLLTAGLSACIKRQIERRSSYEGKQPVSEYQPRIPICCSFDVSCRPHGSKCTTFGKLLGRRSECFSKHQLCPAIRYPRIIHHRHWNLQRKRYLTRPERPQFGSMVGADSQSERERLDSELSTGLHLRPKRQ